MATGRLPAGIAIIRVSGPAAADALVHITGALPSPRRATHARFVAEGDTLDHGVALYFPGPHSVTGEDCAEFHIHGSRGVARALSAALLALPGLREAEPGEFTRRAFLNGRMDLTGVESLSDLIAAETEQQLRLALSGVSGTFRDMCLGWRADLQTLRAQVEAGLDFSDQDDFAANLPSGVEETIAPLISRMTDAVARAAQAEIVRDGYTVAIVGAPNAGKSSLLNALAMRDVAIVTAEPGTTRDVVEVVLDIAGYRVVVRDTAGLREADALAEMLGVARSLEAARSADLVLLAEDMRSPQGVDFGTDAEIIRIGTKCDLVTDSSSGEYDLRCSSITGIGVTDLLSLLRERVAGATSARGQLLPIRERHVRHIERAMAALRLCQGLSAPELIAEELRVAAIEVGKVVGIGDTEGLLGEIFSRFCIGK